MSKQLRISSELSLPLDAVTQTFAILARKRVGKTYTASVIAEEMMKANMPIVVLDPTGAWWGLRSSADGKREGFPIIIIGGAHGDLPLDEYSGKIIADMVVDYPGYYIIDFSSMESNAAQDRFATEFASHFYRRKQNNRFPIHLFVDEADAFAPQKPFPGQQKMLGAFEAIVRRGGIFGIGITMITQRSAVLNKNILTQAEVLIALQITHPNDQDVIKDWVSRNGTKEQQTTLMASLASLTQGEAWVWSPSWLGEFKKIHVRKRETFNSSATPKPGETVVIPKKLADVDIENVKAKLTAKIEAEKANDPKVLKKTITEQAKEIARLTKQIDDAEIPEDKLQVAIDKAVAKDREQYATITKTIRNSILELEQSFSSFERGFHSNVEKISKSIDTDVQLTPIQPPKFTAPVKTPAIIDNKPKIRQNPISDTTSLIGFKLSQVQQRILNALAWFESIGNNSPSGTQLGAIALIDTSGGYFSNVSGPLSSQGLIERGRGTISLTNAGRALAEAPESTPTLEDYHNVLRQRVRKAKSASGKTVEVMNVIIDRGGESITTEEIGQAVGIDHTGGYFSNTIGPLSTLGIIRRERGTVTPTEVLFPVGL